MNGREPADCGDCEESAMQCGFKLCGQVGKRGNKPRFRSYSNAGREQAMEPSTVRMRGLNEKSTELSVAALRNAGAGTTIGVIGVIGVEAGQRVAVWCKRDVATDEAGAEAVENETVRRKVLPEAM
jgi:hypothetical protein